MNSLDDFLLNRASPALVGAFRKALACARQRASNTTMAHMIDALLDDPSISNRVPQETLSAAKARLAELIRKGEGVYQGEPGAFAFSLSDLIGPAIEISEELGAKRVSPLSFLGSCLKADYLADRSTIEALEAVRVSGLKADVVLQPKPKQDVRRVDFTFKSLGFGIDVTAKARAGFWDSCPLVGMEGPLNQLLSMISSGRASPVIVGEPGVGKSALVDGLAFHIANETRPLVPPLMDGWSVVMFAARDMLAGTGAQGDLETRLNEFLAFFNAHPNVVAFFDEIHTILDTNSASARAIATALKPPMADGLFKCIGATTDQEYARFIASDQALNGRFTKILVQEPDHSQCFSIIQGILQNIMSPVSKEAGIRVNSEAVKTAIKITARYNRSDRLPRKAKQLLEHAICSKTFEILTGRNTSGPIINEGDVASVFSDITGIPVDSLNEEREEYYLTLNSKLKERVIGQNNAIDSVTSWLGLHARGWVDPRRPRGRFLFLGPPGVGKTELARALAEEIMRERGSLVVKNMAEYRSETARSRFMGADPGYKGFGETATIYNKVMMRSYSVVVLDEIEKAHESLSDPLLSIFDGEAEDAQGRYVDFSQCIFILTSNAIHGGLDWEVDDIRLRRHLIGLGGIWQPAFVDRIDRVILFRPLAKEMLLLILDQKIAKLRSRAARPLPKAIDSKAVRGALVAEATKGEGAESARRLERSLLQWLVSNSGPGKTAKQHRIN